MVTDSARVLMDIKGHRATRPHDPREPGRLLSYSRPIRPVDLLQFLRHAPGTPRLFWQSARSRLAFAGYGTAADLIAEGTHRFATVQRDLHRLFADAVIDNQGDADVKPRVFGGFAFRGDFSPAGVWSAFPAAYFTLPRVQITQVDGETWLTLNQVLADADQMVNSRALLREEFDDISAQLALLPTEPLTAAVNAALTIDYPLSQADWHTQITRAVHRIRAGELEKVVLSRTCDVQFERAFDPTTALTRLGAKYPDTFRFMLEPLPGHTFFGATPELLGQVEGDALTTAALAGSIRRGQTGAEDRALADELFHNPKERHEHQVVVDALRHYLQPLTTRLDVAAPPDILRLSNIQHLYTPISGRLRADHNLLDVVETLHPTPALGGHPQREALDAIRQIEQVSRGWYASPVGWLDADGDGMFAVAIRSAVAVGRQARLYAGAGIVADSDPDREWAETGLKFKPMLSALGIDIDAACQS